MIPEFQTKRRLKAVQMLVALSQISSGIQASTPVSDCSRLGEPPAPCWGLPTPLLSSPRGDIFFGRGPKEGFPSLDADKKRLCLSGAWAPSLCLSCTWCWGDFTFSRYTVRVIPPLKKKGIKWLMSNRCKHSEYWPKREKKNTHKHIYKKRNGSEQYESD